MILNPDTLREVEEEAVDRCMSFIEAITDELIINGETYGDVSINSDEDFTTFYVGLDQRGILPYLSVVNHELATQWRSRYERTAGRLMGIR